jgi:hypothetical protein
MRKGGRKSEQAGKKYSKTQLIKNTVIFLILI